MLPPVATMCTRGRGVAMCPPLRAGRSRACRGTHSVRAGVARSQPAALRIVLGLWHDQHHARALLRSSHSASVPGPISPSMFSLFLHTVVMPAITMVDKPPLCAHYALLGQASGVDAVNRRCRKLDMPSTLRAEGVLARVQGLSDGPGDRPHDGRRAIRLGQGVDGW